MNSYERVKAVMNLEVPDKIPFGEFAIDFDTVEKILGRETYLRAKAKSQIALWEGRRDEVVQSWKEDMVELYKKLDCIDIVYVTPNGAGYVPPADYVPNPPKKIDHNTWEDEEGKIYKLSEATMDITMVHDPKMWQKEYKVQDFEDRSFTPPDPTIFEVVDYVMDKLGHDKYLVANTCVGDAVEMPMLGPMERAFMEYALNPEAVLAAAEYHLEKANYENQWFIRKGQHGVLWGQDFAYKSGSFISPDMFAKFVFPYVKERVKLINKIYNMPVLKHACGNNWGLLDMFVDIGYSCYQGIQDSASMDIKELKGKYGDKICLWGGIPLEELIGGTPEDIKKSVKYAIESAKENGGYIFGSSHSIAVGTKYDNFMTMLEEFDKLRTY